MNAARWNRIVPWALGLAVVAGCGGGAFRAPLRTGGMGLSDSDRAERIALGAVDPDLASDPPQEIRRLRRIADLELRVGNHGLAVQAMRRALHVARAYAALAPETERGAAEGLRE